MRVRTAVTATLLMGACASGPDHYTPAVSVVDDFVAVAQLVATDRVDRLTPLDSWYVVNNRYVILRAHDADYLFHLQRPCDEIIQQQSVTVIGTDGDRIQLPWTRFSECRIEAIYRLSQRQAVELYDLGSTPLSGSKQ